MEHTGTQDPSPNRVTKAELVELKSLASPPRAVVTVLSAAFVLLGDDQKKAVQWSYAKSQLNNDALMTRMKETDTTTLSAKNARKAHAMVADLSVEVVAKCAKAAVGITLWVQYWISQVCPDIVYDETPRPQSAQRPTSPRKPALPSQEHRPSGAQANHEALLAESKKQTELLQQILHVQQERLKLEQARLGAEHGDDSAGFSR